MRRTPSGPGFSATDLAAFLACGHRTTLELAALGGQVERPGESEIERRLLERRGLEHERRVLEHYCRAGRDVVTIAASPGADGMARAAAETLAAMEAGADVIYQGALAQGRWAGRPDFLVKVAGGDGRWAHHYEVTDAKLASEAKAPAVLQLCVYTDHVAVLQGCTPRHFHIAPGGDEGIPLALLVADYMAYYRSAKARFEAFAADAASAPYPEPVEHCGVCPWWKRCETRRRADDHLSLVAGAARRHRDHLAGAGVATVVALGALAPDARVGGVGADALARLRAQARLQVRARDEGAIPYELLKPEDPKTGLGALPVPTPGDLFLDLEGDAFVRGEGLEYLFGLVELGAPEDGFSVRAAPGAPRYHAFWAEDAAGEKRAFEAIVDRIVAGRREFRDLHVFHFGHRESDALKKLSCRHKTREDAVDQLLREHVLVDLLPIVRHGLRAGVESYTLKALEPLHGFRRKQDLREAGGAMALYGWWLETGDPHVDAEKLRGRIAAYNEEDCLSTCALRAWLEARRTEWEAAHAETLPRPSAEPETPGEDHAAAREAAAKLATRLLAGLPDDPASDTEDDRARRLMADLLDWHWREAKSGYWEFYRAKELPPEDRLDDRAALASLSYEGVVAAVKRSLIHRYSFPAQEHAIRAATGAVDPDTGKGAGSMVALGPRHIDLSRGKTSAAPHPTALVPGGPIATKAQEASLLAIGEDLARDPSGTTTTFPAARALLLREPPCVAKDGSLVGAEGVTAALPRLALARPGAVVAVQGPPGSGKTYEAACLIAALVAAGKKVGVTANSHGVIKEVLRRALEKAPARAAHIQDDGDDEGDLPFEVIKDKAKVRERLRAGELDLVGGTAWTWAHESYAGSVDVLLVDEAGQVSLANALAVSRAAPHVVLFGDPAQLAQPQKGVHPPGAELSALEHLLGGGLTIAPDRGVFIPRSRRMHPDICAFISKVFYEGRLHPQEGLGLERQAVDGPGVFCGAGLRHVPVPHGGNRNSSEEEVEIVRRLVEELLSTSTSATFVDRTGARRPITPADILVTAPYNAHVAALTRALPSDVLVGTVDKLQGREAPIAIYSMATSSAEEAPRGLEFLYSANRLNVAISRAQALAVLVASPELARVSCKTPRQMKLVNALCTFIEMAAAG